MKRVRAAVVVASCMVGGLLVSIAPPVNADIDSHPGTVAERPRDAAVHAVDGDIRTIAQVGNRVVIGGTFTKIGPVTRGAVGVVDTVGKTFQPGFPDVVGLVSAVASDGAGGWYLGGTFSSVGGQPRTNLAQVDASGAVTTFAPNPDQPVTALAARPGGGVFVGGSFTTMSGVPASGLAALNPTDTLNPTGSVAWNGAATGGGVRALALSGDGARLYLGGDFNKVATVTRQRLAAVNAATGALDTVFLPGTVNLTVNDLIVQASGALLLAGDFTKVNAITHNRLARVDGTTGVLDASITTSINNSVRDMEVDAATNTVYIAGRFSNAGGVARAKLAGINLTTGAATALSLTNITGDLAAVTLDGAGGLYVGGSMQFTPEKGNPPALAQVNVTTSVATEVVPYYESPRSLARAPISGASGPTVLVRTGGNLLVAGDFSDYGITTRNRLAAYDLTTGALAPDFNPSPDAQVNSVKATPDNSAVYVGGEFVTIGGETHNRLAKLNITTGANVSGFNPNANSYVKDMAVRPDGTAVYVGGNFDVFNGVANSRLVAIDPTTGALLANFNMPLTQPTNDESEGGLRAMALSADSNRLMVIGNFRQIAGIDRPLIAQIDLTGAQATVTSWRTDVYDQPCARSGKVGWMRDVDISPDGTKLYVVSSGHIYYPACDSANAFPMDAGASTNVQPLWTKKIGDTMEAVAANTDTVYISGHFRYLETETHTQPRFQIAALDAQTGEGLNWIPNAGGFRGVLTLELEPAGLFAGSDGDAFGVVSHGRNAFWPRPNPGIEVRKTSLTPWILTPSGSVTYTVRVQNTFTDRSVNLTSLTDTRLGSLAGAGTCSLPQSISAGASYSCQVSETVAGAASTDVTGTVTATATPTTGADVTDTDTSDIQILATAPVFRARVVAGPAQVVFPGGTVRFSISLMNLDLTRSATLTTLTSPQFGDLAPACGLPLVIAPNRLVYCHVDRPVSGPVGSKPVYSFAAQASYNTGTLSSSSSATITMNPPVGGTKVLAVVGNIAALTGSDKKIQDFLEDNFAITYVDDNTASAADVTSDYSFVILDPSVVPTKLGNRLAGITTPVMLTHSQLLDEMGMAATGADGTLSGTTVNVVKSMHPLSTGTSGTVAINTAAQTIAWGTPGSAAQVITQVAANQATEFAYAPGATMPSGPAPACRVYFSAANPTKFSTTAWALFNRAAAYTSDSCGENMLWTSAGSGATAYGTGEGRQSVTVGLNTPWGLAIDSAGRIYVADAGNNAVRRIAVDGTVTTVAGTGTAGFSGDGGQATLARLSAPLRLAFDAAGNLYIADSANNRIRKVTPAGIISTVAGNGTAGFAGDGGAATAARLRTPTDVAIKPDGTMYIADRANFRVRKVTPAGIISTIAGTGTAGYNGDDIAATTARLNNPYSVAFDAAGNIYIADYDNERLRMINTGGLITTIAGTGVATADGDGGDATLAGLHKPQYVQIAPNGDIILCESNNNDVRIIHDGTIDTIAGSRQFGFAGDGSFPIFSTWQRPSGTVLDGQGNLWIADRNNHRLRVVQASN